MSSTLGIPTSEKEYAAICLRKYKALYPSTDLLKKEIQTNQETFRSTIRIMLTIAAKDKGEEIPEDKKEAFQEAVVTHFMSLIEHVVGRNIS